MTTPSHDQPHDSARPAQSAAATTHPGDPSAPPEPGPRPKLGSAAWKDLTLYALARIGLFIVITVVIQSVAILLGMGDFFPLLMSAMLALFLALPLSMFIFKGLRLRVTEHIARWDAARRAHKAEMHARLNERF